MILFTADDFLWIVDVSPNEVHFTFTPRETKLIFDKMMQNVLKLKESL